MLDAPLARRGCIWVHACSVGEVASVVPLIRRVLAEGHEVHLTVVTNTGFEHARRLLGERVGLSFLPWDLPGLMRRFVLRLQPRLLVLTETEFWPGMLSACHAAGVPIMGVNTRISDRSFPRYRATRWLWRRVLNKVDVFLPASRLDGERLMALGVERDRIRPVGNLKYAITPPDIDASRLRRRIDPAMSRPVLLLASTHDDEERRLLGMLHAWRQFCPDLLAVFVPRHPERFDEVAELICMHGQNLHRWSQGDAPAGADVLLVDAMGQLSSLYAVADLVFIGGSLVDVGGHNPLEAAVCGRGVVTGPFVQNFREVMHELVVRGGAVIGRSDDEVEAIIKRWLEHPEELRGLHARAAAFMQQQRDVLDRVWAEMAPKLA